MLLALVSGVAESVVASGYLGTQRDDESEVSQKSTS
jgi:hypothetical protein